MNVVLVSMDEHNRPNEMPPRSEGVDRDADGRGRAESGPFSSAPMDHAARIESDIQQSTRAGEFDNLPGAGKPLRNLGGRMSPDWWIQQEIEDEKLGGLGPASLTLRSENVGLQDRLDKMHHETDVREALDDFNRRIIDARRQLQGGPPVVTPTRDINAEVANWRDRRKVRTSPAEVSDQPGRSWRERRQAKRAERRHSLP